MMKVLLDRCRYPLLNMNKACPACADETGLAFPFPNHFAGRKRGKERRKSQVASKPFLSILFHNVFSDSFVVTSFLNYISILDYYCHQLFQSTMQQAQQAVDADGVPTFKVSLIFVACCNYL